MELNTEFLAAKAKGDGSNVLNAMREKSPELFSKPEDEAEDWLPKEHPNIKDADEIWGHKGTQKQRPPSGKPGAVKISRSKKESREAGILPTVEQCKDLQRHQEYKWFQDGMWQSFLRETKDLGLTENERRTEFTAICQEFLQEHIQVLVKRGNLRDWQEFVGQVAPKVEKSTENVSAKTILDNADADDLKENTTTQGRSVNTSIEDLIPSSETAEELKIEAKDWREVKREVEVEAVGDLHSSYEGFKENLKSLGVVQEGASGDLFWIGGNKQVVLVGDILADRNQGGLDILRGLEKLRPQVEAAGGKLDVLAGNHDDFEISFLAGREIAGGNADPIANSQVGDQGLDLLNLHVYGSLELQNYDFSQFQFEHIDPSDPKQERMLYDPVWELIRRDQKLIIENMRKDPEGRRLLEQMCKFKIAEVKDDTLFVHTDFTEGMARTLLEGRAVVAGDVKATVKNINDYFESNLRKILVEGQKPDEDFDKLRAIFLKTGNREDFTNSAVSYRNWKNSYEKYLKRSKTEFIPPAQLESYRKSVESAEAIYNIDKNRTEAYVAKFKAWGINAVVRGHSAGRFDEDFSGNDFPIISADMSAFKAGDSKHRSIVKIKRDGVIERAVYPKEGQKDMVDLRS